ncbi:hypothetical protein P3L10_020573 [Capsicum annuum]
MEFHHIVPHEGEMDGKEGSEDGKTPDPPIWTKGVFINQAFIEPFGLTWIEWIAMLAQDSLQV